LHRLGQVGQDREAARPGAQGAGHREDFSDRYAQLHEVGFADRHVDALSLRSAERRQYVEENKAAVRGLA
jgi:hypothetical protein